MILVLVKPISSEGGIYSRLWNVVVQQYRFRNRPNLQRPLPNHFNRERMYKICTPIYPPKPKFCDLEAIKQSQKKVNPVVDNPYAIFLAGKLRRDLLNHPLVCVFHHNSFTQHELIDFKGNIFDMKFEMKLQQEINYNVARMALNGTRWSPLLPILNSPTVLGFCPDPDVPKLMKVVKKMPQFILIAAIIQGRFLHKDDLEKLSKLGDITNVRAQLCSTLANPSSTISQSLMSNLNALSYNLATYAKPEEENSSSGSSSEKVTEET